MGPGNKTVEHTITQNGSEFSNALIYKMKLEPVFSFPLFELVNRKVKKTTTATGMSLNKRFNEQNSGCPHVL